MNEKEKIDNELNRISNNFGSFVNDYIEKKSILHIDIERTTGITRRFLNDLRKGSTSRI